MATTLPETVFHELTQTQKAAFVHDIEVPISKVMAMSDADLNIDFFQRYSVPPCNLVAAQLGPEELKASGVTTA